VENLKRRDHLEDIVEGRIILKFMLGNMVEECGLDSSRPGQRPLRVLCEHVDL